MWKMLLPITMPPVRRIYTILWILFTILVLKVSCSGVFELSLTSFRNQAGTNHNGDCCNGTRTNGQCTSKCRTFIRICLKHYQADISPDPPCTFGTITTDVLGGNSFNFDDTSFGDVIKLPFSFSWPGTFSLIIEAWHDTTLRGPSKGSPRELIARLATQRALEVGEQWHLDTYYSPNTAELNYSYRVICDDNYYGSTCSVSCQSRDDKFGHYTCSEDGTRQCLEGWQGEYCDKAVCLHGCHSEYGMCESPNECNCKLGWMGKLCDECRPYPGCDHGTCEKPWDCNCLEGWGGLFCNQDLNFCTTHAPCKNGATCENTGTGSYTCECPPGYTGTECEIEVDDCKHHPCLNGGTCTDVGTGYECRCPEGVHGRHCESTATSCDESPCQNGGVCASLPEEGYRCNCLPGYQGKNCEIPRDECASNPCSNNGRCIDEDNGYRCVCPPGYSGEHCHDNTNNCEINPCLNGGTCVDKVNDFKCHCEAGFTGPLCQDNVDDCLTFPCANGGTCHDLVNDFSCTCANGFTDKDCRTNVNECLANPCQHGGTCYDQVNDFHCACVGDYYGKHCEYNKGDGPPPVVTPSTPKNDETSSVSSSGGVGTPMTPATVIQDESVLNTNQLVLIICLGLGIPILIITIVIIVLFWQRRRNRDVDHTTRENEQNEEKNMNNKTKCIDTKIINAIPASLKVTNEESSRTIAINKNHLNIDKNYFHKDVNTHKDNTMTCVSIETSPEQRACSHSNYNSHLKTDAYLAAQSLSASTSRAPSHACASTSHGTHAHRAQRGSTLDPGILDIRHPEQPEVHINKPTHKEANSSSSIFFLEKHLPSETYSEGMLATEV